MFPMQSSSLAVRDAVNLNGIDESMDECIGQWPRVGRCSSTSPGPKVVKTNSIENGRWH